MREKDKKKDRSGRERERQGLEKEREKEIGREAGFERDRRIGTRERERRG